MSTLLCALLFGLSAPVHAAPPIGAQTAPVVVNGRPASLPGVLPGRYWYDARSGLWGYAGGPSEGFYAPGLALGPLDPDASGGGTAVVLNGRILPPADLQFFTSVFGPIAPGRYWLDAVGNVGLEGGPAVDNLHVAMALRGQQPGAGGATGTVGSIDVPGYNGPMHAPTDDIDIGGGEFETISGDIWSE
ncbi:MAG: hypothetical protein R3F59_25815 [Myxococcota bacterium]